MTEPVAYKVDDKVFSTLAVARKFPRQRINSPVEPFSEGVMLSWINPLTEAVQLPVEGE